MTVVVVVNEPVHEVVAVARGISIYTVGWAPFGGVYVDALVTDSVQYVVRVAYGASTITV